MNRVMRTLMAVLLALGLGVSATAAPAERWTGLADSVFQHIGTDSGLPHPSATAVVEDGDGFLWIGTENGLARWDGYRIRAYQPGDRAAGALPDHYIQTLHTDQAGRLWVGTSAAGLARYDRDTDRFVTLPVGGPGGLSHVNVHSICDDGAGGLWVGTDGGLDHLDPAGGTIHHVPLGAPDGPPEPQVFAALRDHSGTLWIGTRDGLARLEGTGPATAVPLPLPQGTDWSVQTLFEDSGRRLWIGTQNHGVLVLDPGDGAIHTIGDSQSPRTRWVNAIAEIGPDEIWIGTSGQGLLAVDTATWRIRPIRHDPTLPDSLAHDVVRDVHRDRAGLVWVATGHGLSRHDPRQTAILNLFGASQRPNGITEADIHAVLPMPDGRVWLGSRNSGIDILDPASGRIGTIRSDPSRPETALPERQVVALAASPAGDVFIGTEGGLYRSDLSARRVARVPANFGAVHAVLLDGNKLWIGSLRDGFWTADVDAGGGLRADQTGASGLTDGRVRALGREPGGAVWIGTRNGLNRIDPASRNVERILPGPRESGGLAVGSISSLAFDRRGRLWVGTLGGGIELMEARDPDGRPHFHQFDTAQGLPNANVTKLLTGPDGNIWASTADGIAMVDAETLAVRAFRRAEGDAILLHSIGAGAVTPEGEILFGGHGGLTVIRPDRLVERSTYQPPVVITEIRVGGRAVPAGRFSGADAGTPLGIAPGADSLAVEFSALDYSAPERNRYAYRLDGFDDDWIETDSTRRVATYTNLSPGTYTLRLRGTNRDGLWSEAALALPVRVLPAWYQTWWFRGLAGLAGAMLVVGLVQARTAFLRRHQRELEETVATRTRELRQSQLQLEQMAFFDTLTGLPNRRMFNEDFQKAMALCRRQGGGFGMLFIDLDGFKDINDGFGHDAGDAVLVETARRLKAAVRDADLVSRLGGDEFAILLRDGHDRPGIDSLCRRITDSFAESIASPAGDLRTSPSMGVAVFPDDGTSQEELCRAADQALYRAKRAGRNTWCWHQPELNAMLAPPANDGRPAP